MTLSFLRDAGERSDVFVLPEARFPEFPLSQTDGRPETPGRPRQGGRTFYLSIQNTHVD